MSEILSTGGNERPSESGDGSGGPVRPDGRRKRNGRIAVLISALAAVLVLALGVGVFAAVRALSGGGKQPEDLVPADALAFARLDLDPPAGEKLDALRFLRKFDALRATLPDGDDIDLGRWFAQRVVEGSGTEVDFERDVEPWLGKRFAIAAVPAGDDAGDAEVPVVVAILQVDDETKAQEGLGRILADGDDGELVVRDGYAYLGEDRASIDDFIARAGHGSLAGHGPFQDAIKAVGDESILVGYVDLDKAAGPFAAAGGLAAGYFGAPIDGFGAAEGVGGGRYAFGLNLEPSYAELVGAVRGAADLPTGSTDEGTSISRLPASTIGALSLVGGGDWITDAWEQLTGSAGQDMAQDYVEQFEQETGLTLPDDLAVLLGESLVLAVDRSGLPDEVVAGARVRTDAQHAAAVADRLAEVLPFALDDLVAWDADGDYFLIGSDPGYLDALSAGGDLGASERFRTALPDANHAQVAAWLDFDALYELLEQWLDNGDALQALDVLDALGASSTVQSESSATFRMRITLD